MFSPRTLYSLVWEALNILGVIQRPTNYIKLLSDIAITTPFTLLRLDTIGIGLDTFHVQVVWCCKRSVM